MPSDAPVVFPVNAASSPVHRNAVVFASGQGIADEPAPPPTLERAEIQMIRAALEAASGNISAASKQLGISRNTIYRKLRWNVADRSV